MSVLAVVLDAADAGLLRRWVRAGELPVLAHMMEAGASAKLESPAAPMHEAEWVTLTTGTNAGGHGVYHWRAVRPGTYQRTRQPPAACRKACWDVLRDALPEARAVVAQLCQPVPGRGPGHSRRIVGVLVDGLRCGSGDGSRASAG